MADNTSRRTGTRPAPRREEPAPAEREEPEVSQEEQTDAENSERSVQFLLAEREGKRKIKLHDQNQKKGKSLKDAVVVRKTANMPDMRFAEDQMAFKPDPSKRLDGKPDGRFIDNRPDLLEVHARRGETKPNFIFTEDMGALPTEEEVEA